TVTTSQTNRFSDPAHVAQGNPSARAAWTTSSAVCSSQPTLTPQVARRPAAPGRRASPAYASAASPYATSAGQKRSSTTGTPPRKLGQLTDLPLQPGQLQRHDHDVENHEREDDEVCGRDVLFFVAHTRSGAGKAGTSAPWSPPSSLRLMRGAPGARAGARRAVSPGARRGRGRRPVPPSPRARP